jgi:plasmid maintenance system antidote protein VapI
MAISLERGESRLPELLGNMSPTEFARRMGVYPSAVTRWISGERDITYENAVLACRILNCHAEDLHYWIEVPRKNKRP